MQQTLLKVDTSRIPAQKEFMESLAPELLYSGAFGAGKSRIGCEKGHFLSMRYAGNRGLICRKTYTDLRDTTQDTFFRYVCPEEHIAKWLKNEHKLVLKNGSEILFHGLDTPTKIGSLEVGWIFCDEIIEFSEEDYSMLLGRLRHPVPFHQIFGATNPSSPQHWVHKRFYQDEKLRADGTVHLVESNAIQNPFTPDSYKKRLDTLTGRYHDRYVKGLWIGFEGMVYDNWDPVKYVLPRDTVHVGLTGNPYDPIPHEWEKYRVIDFGFTNPFVCQWWSSPKYRYEGEEGRQDRVEVPFGERVWVMYREIYMSQVTTPEHAKEINLHSNEKNLVTTYADWDSGDRALLDQAGIATDKAVKEVSAGLQTVYEMIDAGRIFILEDSLIRRDPELIDKKKPLRTADEFPNYIRPTGKDGVRNPREDPAKVDDHGMDCLRMLFHTLAVRHLPEGGMFIGSREEVYVGGTQGQNANTAVWSAIDGMSSPDRKYTGRDIRSTRSWASWR